MDATHIEPDAYSVDDTDPYGRFSLPEKVTPSYLNPARWGLLADELACDFFHEHDGWECRWPVTLYIWRGDTIAASFSVELDHSPQFNSYDRKDINGEVTP